MKTLGISPKVLAALLTGVFGWLATRYGLDLDPDVAVSYTLALLTAAGIVAPPGVVIDK